MSKNVSFILQGRVHIMNSNGMFDYGQISEGGYYGDISALLGVPNEFSYLYNTNADKPLLIITIPTGNFMEIVNRFPAVKEILTERARKRLDNFRNFR